MFRIIPTNASKCLVRFNACSRQGSHAPTVAANGHDHHHDGHFDREYAYPSIGKREIVGYGLNGNPSYFDMPDFPCPGIRWKADTPAILALKKKEQGDWKNLSIEDKRELYRASFRQTFPEMTAPNSEWKATIGFLLGIFGFALISYNLLFKNMIYNYPKPQSMSEENEAKMLERMIAQGQGRVFGVASKWDYEKGDWKWNTNKK